MISDRTWAVATLGAIVAAIAVNYLVGAPSADEPSVGEVSANYETLVTPAGYAFAIWGLIYAGLISFGIFQVLPTQRDNPRFRYLRPLVLANCFLNGAWIFAFTNQWITLSTALIAGLLLTLVYIHHGVQIGRQPVAKAEVWTTWIPFSIYFGWVTAATIVNVAIALLNAGWDGTNISSERYALFLLGIALSIGVIMFKRFRNGWFVLTLAWALVAIAVKQIETPLVAGGAVMAAFAALLTIVTSRIPSRI